MHFLVCIRDNTMLTAGSVLATTVIKSHRSPTYFVCTLLPPPAEPALYVAEYFAANYGVGVLTALTTYDNLSLNNIQGLSYNLSRHLSELTIYIGGVHDVVFNADVALL